MIKLEVSPKGLLLVGGAAVAIWALFQVWTVVLLMVVAFIFMAALLPYLNWLVRRGVPRAGAVLLVLAGVLVIVGALFAAVIPAMIDEFGSIKDDLPQDAQRLEDFLDNFGIEAELSDRAEEINWSGLVSGRVAVDYGQRVIFGIISSVTILVLTAYLLNDAPKMKAYLFRFIPDEREAEAERVIEALGRVVGGYIRGQIITSALITTFTLIVLLAADVPNAFGFAILAGFADIIPLVGAFIAIIPATFAAFRESATQAVIVLIALLIYQQLEDRFIVPRVYGSTLGLQPLVVLVAVLVGGELLGIPGILLALPAAAALKVAIDILLDRRNPTNALAPLHSTVEVAAPDDPPHEHGDEPSQQKPPRSRRGRRG
ncbi:MAG: AI-2E family transporter [Dehalococcoidia bacterium]